MLVVLAVMLCSGQNGSASSLQNGSAVCKKCFVVDKMVVLAVMLCSRPNGGSASSLQNGSAVSMVVSSASCLQNGSALCKKRFCSFMGFIKKVW